MTTTTAPATAALRRVGTRPTPSAVGTVVAAGAVLQVARLHRS
jgi:hypothetical protein